MRDVIEAFVLLPGAPLLVPELMGAAAPELDELRDACVEAARGALAGVARAYPDQPPVLVAVGPSGEVVDTAAGDDGDDAQRPGRWAGRVSTSDFGWPVELPPLPGAPDGPANPAVPTALLGARWVLGQVAGAEPVVARWSGLTWAQSEGATAAAAASAPTVLIGCLDGAMSHGPKAPRGEHPDAAVYDDAIEQALRSGDPAALAAIDAGTGEQVGALGAPLWSQLGTLLAGREWDARVLWAGHPYGIGYVVASWLPRQAPTGR